MPILNKINEEGRCAMSRVLPCAIDYTNWRGERGWRKIRPAHLWHGVTLFHTTPCAPVLAIDAETGEFRDFAMSGIHAWRDNIEGGSNAASE